MTIRFSDRADKDYAALSADARKAFGKQLEFLLVNPRHPSPRAKKLEGSDDLWQARVNRGWRFYFKIEGDEYPHRHRAASQIESRRMTQVTLVSRRNASGA